MNRSIQLFLLGMMMGSSATAQEVVDHNKSYLSSQESAKGTMALQTGNYQEAKEYFSQAIAIYRGNPDYFYGKALAHYYMEEYDQAHADLEVALAMDGKQASYHYYAGAVLYELKQYHRARGSYEKALEYNGNSAVRIDPINAKFHLAMCIMRMGDFSEAIAKYTEIIEEDPSYRKAFLNRGIAYGMNDQREAACGDFIHAAELGHTKAQVFLKKYCDSSVSVMTQN